MGRPSLKTPELVKAICDRLSQGEPMTWICRDDGMPNPSTVWDWQQADPDVAQAIAHARERGEEAIAEQCLEIADDETQDWAMSKKGVITNEVAIGRAKLRVDTRLKLLAKFNPKRWGDKLELAGDKERPLTVQLLRLSDSPDTEPQS